MGTADGAGVNAEWFGGGGCICIIIILLLVCCFCGGRFI